MATGWDAIVSEANALNRLDAIDVVRRRKIDAVQHITGRHLVIYATDFNNPLKAQFGNFSSIGLGDKLGFDEVTRNLTPDSGLDVLLHSPGGSAEATESIVELLRTRFAHIRFIIPSEAKSAATMMAMAGEQLLMDEQSELGPTDPQMVINRQGQIIQAPAQAIKDQFMMAQEEVNKDPNKLPVWVPILREYGPALLTICDNQLALTHKLVSSWLQHYMFSGRADAEEKAERISRYLSSHNNFLSHARRVGMRDLQELGLDILDLRTQPALHNAVRELYTAIAVTFANTGAIKIFENDRHEALIQTIQINATNIPGGQIPQSPSPTSPSSPKPTGPRLPPNQPRNRVEERRRQKGQR